MLHQARTPLGFANNDTTLWRVFSVSMGDFPAVIPMGSRPVVCCC